MARTDRFLQGTIISAVLLLAINVIGWKLTLKYGSTQPEKSLLQKLAQSEPHSVRSVENHRSRFIGGCENGCKPSEATRPTDCVTIRDLKLSPDTFTDSAVRIIGKLRCVHGEPLLVDENEDEIWKSLIENDSGYWGELSERPKSIHLIPSIVPHSTVAQECSEHDGYVMTSYGRFYATPASRSYWGVLIVYYSLPVDAATLVTCGFRYRESE